MLRSAVSLFWCVWFFGGIIVYFFLIRTIESIYWNYRTQRGDEPGREEFQRFHMLVLITWIVLSLVAAMISNAIFPLI
jgi:hypothetical protein